MNNANFLGAAKQSLRKKDQQEKSEPDTVVYLDDNDDPSNPLWEGAFVRTRTWCSTSLSDYTSTIPIRKPITAWLEEQIVAEKNVALTYSQFLEFKSEQPDYTPVMIGLDEKDINKPMFCVFHGFILHETMNCVYIIHECEFCGTHKPAMEYSGCSSCGALFEKFTRLERLDA